MVEQKKWNKSKKRDCQSVAELNGHETMVTNWEPKAEVLAQQTRNVSTGLYCQSTMEVSLHSENTEVCCVLLPHP